MKKIEGLDLTGIFDEAENETLAEKKLGVKKIVSGIMINLQGWRREREQGKTAWEKSDKKLGDKIDKAVAKLEQIKAGNWDILIDENDKKQGATETADAD
jgi:hypothetical protein